MNHCQVCGRYPAKQMTFKVHQGFIIFRRVAEISGVFCRDHAIEAYLAARGATLKGMWFSPGSLFFGALRSLHESIRLLDLPEEVKDEPWVLHIAACPHCRCKNVAAAGPVICGECNQTFTVAACGSCRTVHVLRVTSDIESVSLTCRRCGKRTNGPHAIRNWSPLLVARALAEVCADIASADDNVEEVERDTFRAAIRGQFEFRDTTSRYLENYFDQCVEENIRTVLQAFSSDCHHEFLRLFLAVGVSIAQADGRIDESETEHLRRLARLLGIDPDTVFGETWNQQREAFNTQAWWIVLGIPKDASTEEITFAYRKLAMQFHPDIWAAAPKHEQIAATERMKVINAAFEQAKRTADARAKKHSAERPSKTKAAQMN